MANAFLRIFLLIFVFLFCSAFVSKFAVDRDLSKIRFSIDYLNFLPVTGNFLKFESQFEYSNKDQNFRKVIVRIDADSVNTGNRLRDDHIKHEGFFDVNKHREIVYRSFKIRKTDEDEYSVTGHLQLKGKTLPVPAKVTVLEREKTHIVVRFEMEIDRKKFGLNPISNFQVSDGLIGKKARVSGVFYSRPHR